MHSAESHPSGSTLPHSIPARVEKCTTRHLFSASDLDAITRNAEEILEFHESLVHHLRQVVSPLGISMSPRECLVENSTHSHCNSPADVHRAINAVSTVFVDHVRDSLFYRTPLLNIPYRLLALINTSLSVLDTWKRSTWYARFSTDTLPNGTLLSCAVLLSLQKCSYRSSPRICSLAHSPEDTPWIYPRGAIPSHLWTRYPAKI